MATPEAEPAVLVTAEQLFALPDDGLRRELVEGVVTVISPSDRSVEVTATARAWVEAGVRRVWVVDPTVHTVAVHRPDGVRVLGGDDVLDGADVLPGFSTGLPDLFA